MRSSEVARLAGLTVRALRHYHQVGILDEPPRSHNGYREYDVHDLVRVLRIKRLATVGIPLDRMRPLLDDTEGDPTTLLDELERELTAQIDRLSAQREVVAQLRSHRSAPDLPPELAPYVAMFAAASLPPETTRADRDQTVLLAHLAGDEGMPYITRFFQQLSAPEHAPGVTSLVERFVALGPDASQAEAEAFIDAFVRAIQPVLAAVAAEEAPIDLQRSAHLLDEQTADLLNPRQREVLEAIEQRLA